MNNEENNNLNNQFSNNESGKEIVEKYKEIDGLPNGYGDFYSSENIDALIEFNKLAANPMGQTMYEYFDNIAKMNSLATEITYKDLMNGVNFHNTEMAKYVNQLKPNDILEKYETARENYRSYYNGLSKDDQEKLNKYSIDRTSYIPEYGLGVDLALTFASADKIKSVVNSQVVDAYIKQDGGLLRKAYSEGGNQFDEKFKNNFDYSTKNMDIIEMSNFYKEVNKDLTDLTYGNPNLDQLSEGEKEKIQQDYKKNIGDLQELYAGLIFERTNQIPEKFETKEQLDEFLAYKEKFLVSVCGDFFADYPYFTTNYVDINNVEREFARKKIAGMYALENAKERYYNLSKVKQVLEKMNYKEIEKLSNLTMDEVLTKEQVKKADGLFWR